MNKPKYILGLDLGVTSIGFAKVLESQSPDNSKIIQLGVRVNPLTTDEQTNFEKGKPVSVNATRTLKRGQRRNLDRYQLRRKNLIEILKEHQIISETTILAEDGKGTTHSTYAIRAKAATEEVTLEEFARALLAINKKRGYKSSRKAKNQEEGQLIDGMTVAKRLYEEGITPGQLAYQLLTQGKRHLPDFYRSDLQDELDKIWDFQKKFYPDILSDEFKKHIDGKGQRATAAAFWGQYGFNTAENKGTREEKKIRAYQWRNDAVSVQLTKEEVAFVITEVKNDLSKSSGYLGAISDRSKELYFTNQTIGQKLYSQLREDSHSRTKGQVFYRQDYLDEFERIWETQAKFHSNLTKELKEQIRDVVIFFQRKLKSQKGQISFCEFERKEIYLEEGGIRKKKLVGLRVAPKSSLLFQEFKIWQVLNNLEFRNKASRKKHSPDQDEKQLLFSELNIKGNLSPAEACKILGYDSKEWELNYTTLEGNRTAKLLFDAYLKILSIEGYDEDLLKPKGSDEFDVSKLSTSAIEIKAMVASVFETMGINTAILDFDAELEGKAFESQASYQLWHLLYSYEEDKSLNGNERLYQLLNKKFGFKLEHAKVLGEIVFANDFGSLSSKAMRRIFTYIKELTYDKACFHAGYRHSAESLTKDENEERVLLERLDILKKNELRSPVVEKILNQMINLVNVLIDEENRQRKSNGIDTPFHFDEIRIELARELKKSAAERAEMTSNINAAKQRHEKIIEILEAEFGVPNPTRNDIIRYKLYQELKNNGYKDIYTNTYISPDILFSKQIDVDHIIPQMSMFDDSFSNKTIVFRSDNQEKGNETAYDYIERKFGETGVIDYMARITSLFESGKKNPEDGISKAKFQKLQKRKSEIGVGFIERDLRESQYIARKAKSLLRLVCRTVVSTSGEITARLRKDWGLTNVLQEINVEKYRALGLTEFVSKKDGGQKERIIDWSKRDDHRHHAMDALTIAFTKQSHIQYLNHLNARRDESDKWHPVVNSIEEKETVLSYDDFGNRERKFKEPIPNFRDHAKRFLEEILVSHKAKNKVVTKNRNRIHTANGEISKTELTPRGQLHKETIYRKYRVPIVKEIKVGANFDQAMIEKVTNKTYRELLTNRLASNGGDPKKAFTAKNALSKYPIYLDEAKSKMLPEKVLVCEFEEEYSVRKDVTFENFKDGKSIEKVLDAKVREILRKRLSDYDGDAKRAFSDLGKNPIWFNREKSISIKRVKVRAVKNAQPLHHKRDHRGLPVTLEDGTLVPTSFVSTGNNHHVAVYRDSEGNLQDNIVTLFEAVQLVNAGEPVVNTDFNSGLGWRFLFTMKQNEMFVFPNEKTGFDPNQIDLLNPANKAQISPNLFRVQKLSKVGYGNSFVREYVFRHHLETSVDEVKTLKDVTFRNLKSLSYLEGVVKVRIDHKGDIVELGEY